MFFPRVSRFAGLLIEEAFSRHNPEPVITLSIMKLNLILCALLGSFLVPGAEADQLPAALRKKASELGKKGNWNEALSVSRGLLERVDDEDSGKDLADALRYLRELGQVVEADEIIENAVGRHPGNSDL